MKNAENNEIDLLLRSLAKRDSSLSAEDATENGEALAHLDPDELSSFAEGVLPPATRATYAAHLADCSRCRKIVAQLFASSGASTTVVAPEPSKPTLWNYLSRFLTPAVMRYAVPALSLTILVAVGLVWFRQSSQGDLARTTSPAAEEVRQTSISNERVYDGLTKADDLKSAPKADQPSSPEAQRPAKTEVAKNEVDTGSFQKEQAGATPAAADVAPAPTVARSAEAPATYAPPPPKEVAEEESKRDATAKRRVTETDKVSNAQSRDERRSREDSDDSAKKDKSETSGAGSSMKPMAAGRASLASSLKAVGGRQFRLVNDIWIDTAYDSDARTTTVVRGSEQYRALIGDEPGLKTIADQLEGEIIVVWKGRAYRIR